MNDLADPTLKQILHEINNLAWKVQQLEQKIDSLTHEVRQIKNAVQRS